MKPRQIIAPEVRFWRHVDKTSDCWNWTGGKTSSGYGLFAVRTSGAIREQAQAHRFAYAMLVGPIPDGLCVLHQCDNRACVNPAHLHVGTQMDNVREMVERGRHRPGSGERHARARFTIGDVKRIRAELAAGSKAAALAREYGVTGTAIYQISKRRTWKAC